MKKIAILCLLLLSLLNLLSYELYDEQGRQQYYLDRVIVKLSPEVKITRHQEDISLEPELKALLTGLEINHVERLAKTKLMERNSLDRFLVLSFQERDSIAPILKQLNISEKIEYAEAMPIFYPDAVPNDASYSSLHHIQRIQSEEAWDIHKGQDGTEEIIVAIVDSGIDWKHEDLVDNIWNNLGEDLDNDGHTIEFINGQWVFDPDDINGVDDDGNGYVDDFVGWNFVNADGEQTNDLDDPSHHGTHCSGLAAGVTNNETGIASISWNVTLMGTGHDSDGGNAYESNCFDGIVYALENGADVISCSWGTGMYSRSYEEIIQEMIGETVILASAGNSNWGKTHYPSGYSNIISVASTASNDVKAYYSSYGIACDISSPGGDSEVDGGLLSTIPGGYASFQGTSMASPFAAGLTALIKSQHPEWTRERVTQQLLATCDNIDQENPNYINKLGAGRINAYRALSEVNPSVTPQLKLELSRVENDAILTEGASVNLSVNIKNYASLTETDNLNLVLSSSTEGVNITNSSWTGYCPADWNMDIQDAFTVEIGQVSVDSLHFTITSSADIDIVYGQEMDFYLPVNNQNKIFIWDHNLNGNDMSGNIVMDFCNNYDIAYDYACENDLPESFLGYKAIFLSWGPPAPYPYYDNHPNIDDYISPLIVDYLENGGNVYIEGRSVMYNQSGQIWVNIDNNTADYFGVSVEDGELYTGTYSGADGSIIEGLGFEDILFDSIGSIDKFTPINGAIELLEADEYGTVAVQYDTGEYKTICSSISLQSLGRGQNFDEREFYLKKILQYLEVPFLTADFTTESIAGHSPLEVDLNNLTIGYPDEYDIAWDFDNDGSIDSNDANPTYTFTEYGSHDVRMIVTSSFNDIEVIKNNFIKVFDGTSSVEIDEEFQSVNLGNSYDLSSDFTIEMWFNPSNWGNIPNVGFAQVWSWGYNGITLIDEFTDYQNTLAFWVSTEEGYDRIYCNNDAITLGQWHHLAVSYSSVDGYKILINGQEQELSSDLASPLLSLNEDLILGNTSSANRTMLGRFDQVRIYDSALSTNEIVNQMNDSGQGSTTNQVAYYGFNEGSGSSAINEITGTSDAILEGASWGFAVPFETTPISEDQVETPNYIAISNYPNPFKPASGREQGTTISFDIKEKAFVNLEVYNIKGQLVKVLLADELNSGSHNVVWNGCNEKGNKVSAGIYLYRIRNGKYSKSKKMLLMK